MSSSNLHQESAPPSPDATEPPFSFRKRLIRRVKYMVIGCCFSGAYIGFWVDGLAGVAAGFAAGAVIGLCIGLVVGWYAWFLESPLKGAIRGGGLIAAITGPVSLIRKLVEQGSIEFEYALIVAIVAGGAGVVGAILFAFLAWLAGPIFRVLVQEADQGDSPLKHRPWW
jgi:hypothetical protein